MPTTPQVTPQVLLKSALARYAKGEMPGVSELQAIDARALTSSQDITNLGVLWRSAGRPGQAVACYRLSLERGGKADSLWTNMGNALKDLKWMQQAALAHEQAIRAAPRSALAWYNYGIALAADARYADAVRVFKTAQQLPGAHKHNIEWELSRCLLALGDYGQGWDLYPHLWRQPDVKHPFPDVPVWNGAGLGTQRLLLWTDQGFGDCLQCLRFLEPVQAMVQQGSVTVALQPALLGLARQSFPGVTFVDKTQILPPFDVQYSLLELPLLFCRQLRAVPLPQGYLRADRQRGDFHTLRTRYPGKLLVGVVWTGSLTFKGNASRALDAATLLTHVAQPGVQIISLQKGPGRAELEPLAGQYAVHDLDAALQDFADTAAAVSNLDLVVMTDSSVAHLCGALGVPVWVVLARQAHWLWLTDTDTSPWYSSMRFYRQPNHGDWRSPLDALGADLQRRVLELQNQDHPTHTAKPGNFLPD